MGLLCLHCFVTGQVQGVFFRRETCNEAKARGLKGWVRNLADGRVEVLICGEEKAVRTLEEWLWEGPKAANVMNVTVKTLPPQDLSDFEVK